MRSQLLVKIIKSHFLIFTIFIHLRDLDIFNSLISINFMKHLCFIAKKIKLWVLISTLKHQLNWFQPFIKFMIYSIMKNLIFSWLIQNNMFSCGNLKLNYSWNKSKFVSIIQITWYYYEYNWLTAVTLIYMYIYICIY
jgi:hypothetical protein